MNTCSGEICFNISAIELKLYRQFRAGEAHILTLFDDCRIIMSGFRTVPGSRGDRGWLSHGLVVTLPISYSLDGGTMWGFTRDMRIAG